MTWPTAPLKRVAEINRDALPGDTDPDREIQYIDISAVGRGRLVSDPQPMRFGDAPSRARRLVAPGDTIVSTVRTYLRAVVTVRGSTDDLVVSTGFAVVSPGDGMDPGFMSWYLQSDTFVEEVVGRSNGVSYPAINASDLGTIDVRVPPMTVQRAIADFLDAATTRIDALIAKKRRMLTVLEELRWQAFEIALSAAGVTLPDSVDPERLRNAHLPPDWMAPKLSSVLLQLTNGYVGPTRDILRDEGIRYIQGLHIKRGLIDFERRPFYVEEEWHDAHPRTALRPGDVLIVQTGDIGQVAVVPDGFGSANCHALLIARANPDLVSGMYLGMYLQSRFGYNSLARVATGALHPHLEFGIRDVPVVVPPRSVQGEIVAEVFQRQRAVDRAVAGLTHQIDLLIEHRQALITAAVTGELAVAESINKKAS